MRKQADLMKMTQVFASNLRRRRKAMGLTQEQLADVAGLSSNYIARLEIGTSTPSFATLSNLSKALKTRAADLLAAEYEADVPSDINTTVTTLLEPLNSRELDYALSQLRDTVHFVLLHRKDESAGGS